MNLQDIGIIVGVFGGIGGVLGFALSLYQEARHRDDMNTQARLDYRVHQLTLRLTEKLEQLRCANDLLRQFHS